ncbi:hypothetical protein [Streptomyces vinaceus]|uniref:hypothetical protein n=1 Tax=Streptomyces vinaceus TaxID=1960 RepID=UPI0036B9CEAE
MNETSVHMHDLTIAAHGLITDWADVQIRRHLTWHPDIVAHRLELLEKALRKVRQQVDAERADGRWDGPLANADADFNTETMNFIEHSCNCEWCLCGTPAERDDEPLAFTIPVH